MKNSERFLRAYNTISSELEKIVEANRYLPFYRMVDMGKKINSVVFLYKDDLKDLADLRNAIIHDKDYPEFVIAEPHDSVVEKVERIVRDLQKPLRVIPLFEKSVMTFQLNNEIRDILKSIRIHNYSKFPVYDGQAFIGLLTDRGISKWLAHHSDLTVSLKQISAFDLLCHEVSEKNYHFVDKTHTVYDLKALYYDHHEKYGSRLEAILVTESGASNEPLLGMATPFDILRLP